MLIIATMMKELTRDQVIALLQGLVDREGSKVAAANKIGVTSAYLGEILKGTREPGPRILEYFGLERETVYKKK